VKELRQNSFAIQPLLLLVVLSISVFKGQYKFHLPIPYYYLGSFDTPIILFSEMSKLFFKKSKVCELNLQK
jgi:hypothetical protein